MVVCIWKQNDWGGFYETSCDYTFDFINDGPKENGFIHCPKCGKKIVINDPSPSKESE